MAVTERSLGSVLEQARKDKGLSLSAVEQRTGIHNAHLSQIEKGAIRRPEMSMLFELAELYGLRYPELLELAGYAEEAPRSGRERQRMTVAMRAMGQLSAKEQEEVLAYISRLRANRERD
jgi:transcriptional regulator with XRE-family HTH domain